MSRRNDPVIRELIAILKQAKAKGEELDQLLGLARDKSQAVLDNCWEDETPLPREQCDACMHEIAAIDGLHGNHFRPRYSTFKIWQNLFTARDWARSEAQPAGAKL